MADSDSNRSDKVNEALDVFADWLRAWDGRADFAQLCAGRPELADDLRRLHSVFQLAQAAARSRSFHQTLREQFGDVAEVTVKLEEGLAPAAQFVVPPSGGSAPEPAKPGTPNQGSRYTLEDEVARGGMGVIFRVRDRDLSRTLAMKLMTGDPGSTSSCTDATSRLGLARFLEEAQVTAQLDHPGIVPVHEVGFDAQGQPFFTMKLVKGRDLNEIFNLARAEQEGWNLPRAVGAIVKACQALAYAHTKGVIHRDLKPANIMVGRFGEVFVMDWGLAKITGRKDLHDIRPADTQSTSASLHSPRRDAAESTADSPLITMDGSVVGTPAYMPLEQARGQVEEVDQASDIYSLGAILYNLLTGQAPYVEPGARLSPHTILARVLDGPPRRVHQLNPHAPPELIAICEKAMGREKRARYASSLDLAEDLQAWLDRRVVKAYRTGAVAEFKSWVARNHAAALAGAAALIILLAGLASVLFKNQQVVRARRTAEQNLYDSLVREARATRIARRVGYRDEVFKLIERARGLDVSNKDFSELRREAVGCFGDFVGLTPTTFTNFPANSEIWWMRLDSTGRLAAFALSDGRILLREMPSGKEIARLKGDHPPRSLWFSAAGDRLISLHMPDEASIQERLAGSTVHVWARAPDGSWGEAEKLALPGAYACLSSVAGLNVTVADLGSHSVELIDVQSKAVVQRFEYPKEMREPPRAALSPDGRLFATETVDSREPNIALLEVWDLTTGQRRRRLEPHLEEFAGVSFSPDGKHLACHSGRGGAIYATEGFVRVAEYREEFAGPSGVSFDPGGPLVALLILQQNRVRLWDWVKNEDIAVLDDPQSSFAVAFASDGSFVLTSGRAYARLYPLDEGAEKLALSGHVGGTPGVVFSPDSTRIASVGKDRMLKVWDAATGRPIREPAQLPGMGQSVAYSPDGRLMATATLGRQLVSLWNAQTGKRVLELGTNENENAQMWSVQFTSDGRYLATASEGSGPNSGICLWAIGRHEAESPDFSVDAQLVKEFAGDFWSLVLSPNDHHMAFLERRRPAMKIWDWTHEIAPRLATTDIESGWQRESFTPDGTQLLMLDPQRNVVALDVATGKIVSSLPTTAGKVTHESAPGRCLCLSPDGTRLALASTSNLGVDLWDPKTRRLLFSLPEQSGTVWWLAWSPDSQRLAVSRSNGDIATWTLPEIARVLAGLGLSP